MGMSNQTDPGDWRDYIIKVFSQTDGSGWGEGVCSLAETAAPWPKPIDKRETEDKEWLQFVFTTDFM